MTTILVVDDEKDLVDLVVFNLEKAGYVTATAYDGEQALEKARAIKPDLVILDVMLPGMDGFEVCRTLQWEFEMPILMLTALKSEEEKVLGLELGADDYLTKPFSNRELLSRVKAIIRRSRRVMEDKVIQGGDIKILSEKHEVWVKDRLVSLTHKEYQLLHILASNPGRVFTRENLLEHLWGEDFFGDTRTIDVHIRHLREKIETDPGSPDYIITVRGVGYKFKERT